MLPYTTIISEDAEKSLDSQFDNLGDWVKQHEGSDLLRLLHAQDVEVVARSTGALLKAYRNDTDYEADHPEENWDFWAGRYKIDVDEIKDSPTAKDISKAPGTTHRDYYYAIKHIIEKHMDGALESIPKKTLVVLQATGNEEVPDVRMYRTKPNGRMVVAGVKYNVEPAWVQAVLRLDKPNEVIKQAIKNQQQWEAHSQMQRIGDMMDTDTIPLLFRGSLNTTDKALDGLERSIQSDRPFRNIFQRFMSGLPENPTEEDFDQFFRRALTQYDELEIRRMSRQGKVEDGTHITRDHMQNKVDAADRRYNHVSDTIQNTIDTDGHSSPEHEADFQSLRYVDQWLKEKASDAIFSPEDDLITKAIEGLQDAEIRVTKRSVRNWLSRELTESGLPDSLYREHLHDQNVPQNRHWGKNKLWRSFEKQAATFLDQGLDKIADEISQLDDEVDKS